LVGDGKGTMCDGNIYNVAGTRMVVWILQPFRKTPFEAEGLPLVERK